jgi:signal peptidase I
MDFALIMVILLVVTGAIWLLDIFTLRKHRVSGEKEPWWVEYPKSFFPVILAVFMLRSFLVEPFKIPSGSMIPTLLVGDFILVNKYIYGIRIPVIDEKVIDISEPKRGQVMVFRYPNDPSVDYIKRVVGLPGDTVVYRDKHLIINGVPVPQQPDGKYSYVEGGLSYVKLDRMKEDLGGHVHDILINPDVPNVRLEGVRDFPHRENCTYTEHEFTCHVPKGEYFMLGDNRDGSSDGRYWGFVPERNIVGKAFLVWWNFSDLKRIGTLIN